MSELIKIHEQNGSNAISARELHSFLEVNEKFSDWIKRMFEYGFEENLDYLIFSENSEKIGRGRPATDFALTIDTAKEISMIQRSEKGKIARRYFIECEKRLKSQISSPPQNITLPRRNNPMTITGRKNLMFKELMNEIKLNLFVGDITEIRREYGLSRSKIDTVLNGIAFNKDLIKILYKKAISNKVTVEKDIQQMIDNLKS